MRARPAHSQLFADMAATTPGGGVSSPPPEDTERVSGHTLSPSLQNLSESELESALQVPFCRDAPPSGAHTRRCHFSRIAGVKSSSDTVHTSPQALQETKAARMAETAAFRQAILDRTAVTPGVAALSNPALMQPLLSPDPFAGERGLVSSPFGDIDYIRRAAAEEVASQRAPSPQNTNVSRPLVLPLSALACRS